MSLVYMLEDCNNNDANGEGAFSQLEEQANSSRTVHL